MTHFGAFGYFALIVLLSAGCASSGVHSIRPKDDGNITMALELSVDSAGPMDMVEILIEAPPHFIVNEASSTLGPESILPGSESAHNVKYEIAEDASPGCMTVRLTRVTGNRNFFSPTPNEPSFVQFAVLPLKKRKMDWWRERRIRRECARDLKREKRLVADARESEEGLSVHRSQKKRREPSTLSRAKLLEMLESSNFSTRFKAAYSLRGKYIRKAVLVLIESLQRDETFSDAAWALGRSKANALDGVPALKKALSRERLSNRIDAAIALSKIAPTERAGIAALLQGLEHDETFHDSVAALIRIRGREREVIPALKRALTRGEFLDQLQAAGTLAQIVPNATDGIDVLIEGARNDSPWISSFAVDALVRLRAKSPKLLEFMMWAVKNLRGQTAYRVAQVLSRRKGEVSRSAAKALIERSGSSEADERLTAVVLLSMLGKTNPEVIDRLSELLHDSNDDVAARAGTALVEVDSKGQRSFEPLRKALKSERAAVRYGAAAAFRFMKKKTIEAEADLVEALTDEDLRVARAAAIAFSYAQKTPESAVPALLKLANAGDDTSREAALYALGHIGMDSKPVRELCVGGLKSKDDSVFFYSAACLRNIKSQDHAVVKALIRALRKKRNGRTQIILALGAMGREANDAVGPLASIYENASKYDRPQIIKALEGIGTLRAKKALRRLGGSSKRPSTRKR